jgi:class 3 adenylate cyclase
MDPEESNALTEEASGATPAHQNVADDSSDDDWHARTWDLFVQMAKRGVLSPDEFVVFAKELNVDTDAAMVAKFLRSDQGNKITYDTAVMLLENIPIGAVEEIADEGNVADVASNEIALGPWEYFLATCCRKPPADMLRLSDNVTYKLDLPKVSPQFWLIFNASLVFTLVSAGIIALVAVTWLNSVISVEKFYLERYNDLVEAFAASFSTNAVLVGQRDLFDQADTFAEWVKRSLGYRFGDATERLTMEAAVLNTAVAALTTAAFAAESALLTNTVSSLIPAQLELGTLSLSALTALMDRWHNNHGWDSVLFSVGTNISLYSTAGIDVRLASTRLHPCVRFGWNQTSDATANNTQTTSLRNSTLAAVSAAVYLSATNVTLCATATHASLHSAAATVAAQALDTSNAATAQLANEQRVWSTEVLIVDVAAYPALRYASKLRQPISACESGRMRERCAMFQQWMLRCVDTGCMLNATVGPMYDGNEAVAVISYLAEQRIIVAALQPDARMVSLLRQQAIDAINAVNPQLVNDTNVLLALNNDTYVRSQVTQEKVPSECTFPNCTRIPEYDNIVMDAFRGQATQISLRPNAQLRPVIAASSYINAIDVAFTTEQPLETANRRAMESFAEGLQRINGDTATGAELQLIRPFGAPSLKTFDGANFRCPDNALCIENNTNVLFTSSCEHCLPDETDRPPAYVTQVDVRRCASTCVVGQQLQPKVDQSLAYEALAALVTGQETQFEGPDYSGTVVLARLSPITNLSSTIVVKVDTHELRSQVLEYIVIFVCIAVALILIGLGALIFFSHRTLRRIENEWLRFKKGIEDEKFKFDRMIEELVPGPVIERYRAKVRCVADLHNGLGFSYIDLCNFSEKTKVWGPRQVVRTVAYFFHVYDAVATKFDIFRLRSFGDVAVFVAGLKREGDDFQQREAVARDAHALGKFAGYVTQLLSPAFSHYPQKLPQFTESFKHEPLDQPMPTLRCRIGLHNGPAHAGLVDVGKTPFFEMYGPTLAICQRMQATAQVGRVNVSATFKELIETVDAAGTFEFDALKKAVVKGRGAISSYPIKSIQLAIDEVLLHQLKIEHAQRLHMFANKTQTARLEQSADSSSQQTGS